MSVIWQQDEATPQCVTTGTEYLNRKYLLWLGRQGVHWHAKYPDLSPVNFFMVCGETRYTGKWGC